MIQLRWGEDQDITKAIDSCGHADVVVGSEVLCKFCSMIGCPSGLRCRFAALTLCDSHILLRQRRADYAARQNGVKTS